MEEDVEDSREDLIAKFSQSLHRKSGDRMVKGEEGHFKADFEDLHSSMMDYTYFYKVTL